MSNELERRRYFSREDAGDIVGRLAEVGVYASMHGAHRGWQITLNGHTDLVAVAKVLDTFEVEDRVEAGRTWPVNVLYRPYGGEGWPDVLIFWGSKP